MKDAHISIDLHQWRESCDEHVVVARIAEDVDYEQKRCVPYDDNSEHHVGHQHASQDVVGLGPESRRHPDRDQRETVAADVEHVRKQENGYSTYHSICDRCGSSHASRAGRSRCNVDAAADTVVS